MLDDYSAKVKAAYVKLCQDKTTSVNLRKPTPSSLRKECLDVYRRKNGPGDRSIVRMFLNIKEEENLELEIRTASLNKFRAVQEFFKRDVNPRYDNIEFIAWLIDFKLEDDRPNAILEVADTAPSVPPNVIVVPVPFPSGSSADQSTHATPDLNLLEESEKPSDPLPDQNGATAEELESASVDQGHGGTENQDGGLTIVEEPNIVLTDSFSPKTLLERSVLVLVLIAEAAIAYFGFYYDGVSKGERGNSKCMYWAGDHYEAGACDLAVNASQQMIPFNDFEWRNLRAINRPDTLTEKDINKVWYFKSKDSLKLFTVNGRYPLDTNRVLKPLSQYMYVNYLPKIKKIASLEQQLTAGGIGSVMLSSVGIWWLTVVQIRKRKRRKNKRAQ